MCLCIGVVETSVPSVNSDKRKGDQLSCKQYIVVILLILSFPSGITIHARKLLNGRSKECKARKESRLEPMTSVDFHKIYLEWEYFS